MMVRRMVGLLFIEVSAFHTFAWAEEVLADTDLVAGDGAAADLVAYVRADETPHVDYLRTALTEMRDRTFVGESGATDRRARKSIGTLWDAALEQSLGANRDELRAPGDGRGRARARGEPAPRRHPRGVPGARLGHGAGDGAVKFGIFYEHQLPRPVDRRLRVPADPGRARPDRVRRLARHRLRVGGRAPLPRGVLALERARGVPRRRVAAHQEHPARARHRADAAAVQPSGAHRRAHRDARSGERWARRFRHR